MKSAYQIITHIDEIIQNTTPDTAGHAVIVAMTDLIDWIGDREPVEMEPMTPRLAIKAMRNIKKLHEPYAVAIDAAIDALGYRVPVAQEARRGDDGVYKSHCPKCGHATDSGRGFDFCPYCGQKYGRGFLDD